MQLSLDEMVDRLRSCLPTRWFPDDAPVLDLLLRGLGSVWCWLNEFHTYLRRQARIATAVGRWLDLSSDDFFGQDLLRRPEESDDKYRVRIHNEILRERGTRHSVQAMLFELTGREPILFEPGNAFDTGGYGSVRSAVGGGLGYGTAGGWGNLSLPFQVFITAFRPHVDGIAVVPGWGSSTGAYGGGNSVLADSGALQKGISDREILFSVSRVLPAATIAWTRISA